jgi:hypothetical protein
LLIELNQRERKKDGQWKLDTSEMTSVIKFLGSDDKLAASSLNPDDVAKSLSQSSSAQPAAAGH